MWESVGGKVLLQDGENQDPNEWGDPQPVPSFLWTELPHMVIRLRSPPPPELEAGGGGQQGLG